MFTSTSTCPAHAATRSGSPATARSAANVVSPGAVAASASRAGWSRPVAFTRAPRRANWNAALRPIPLDAPVTSTTAPRSSTAEGCHGPVPSATLGAVSTDGPPPVRSIVVDFDGTISLDDVSEGLLEVFADPGWTEFNVAFERGEIGSRDCIVGQAAELRATADELIAYAVEHFPIDPTFPPFVAWARAADIEISIASDGLGLHLVPMLAASGLGDLPIVTNVAVPGGTWRMEFPNAHPVCVYCGACKMNATLEARDRAGPTAFIGDGHSDTFGALFADLVFAKGYLAEHCRDEDIPFVAWTTFDDVRAALENGVDVPGPVNPAMCPGWTVP